MRERRAGNRGSARAVAERPQRFILNGQLHPLPDFPELLAVATQPAPNALHGEVRRPDGSVVGEGDYVLSATE